MLIRGTEEKTSILQGDNQINLSANELLTLVFYARTNQKTLEKEAEKEIRKVRNQAKRDQGLRECGGFFLWRDLDGAIGYSLYVPDHKPVEVLERWFFNDMLQKWTGYKTSPEGTINAGNEQDKVRG